MKANKFGELVFDQPDLSDLIMQGQDIIKLQHVTVDPSVDPEAMINIVQDPGQLVTWRFPNDSDCSVPDYDALQQRNWHMPDQYRNMDIAAHVLNLCTTDQQLQRVGQELLLYQERDMFDLLRYLCYLVDVMKQNRVIWGVGRGSSVASYVLYLLEVHRVDSMFYDLDPEEFLR